MDFSTPPELQDLLNRITAFVKAEVFPREAAFLNQPFFQIEPDLKALRRKVQDAGLWGPQIPADLGGLGLPLRDFALVSEVLGQSPLGHYAFGCQAPDAGNIELMHRHGTPAQRARFLEPLARGEIRSCFAMTEPDTPGSNPTQLKTRAVRDGDHYVVDGHKWFTSSADGAAFAVTMAVTHPDAPAHQRATMFLVPTDTPGYVRVRNIPIMGHAGEGFPSHSEVRFESCRIPAENRLGPEGAGFLLAQERLGPGRIHHCMRWIGICQRAFSLMCERALSRKIDGDEPLAGKQLVQAFIAESKAEIESARLLVLRTAWLIDAVDRSGDKTGGGHGKRGHGPDGFHTAQEDVSLIKFHVANVLQRVVDRAVQVHGALGLTSDTVLSHFYAHERGARIYDGPDEVHKVAAARRILRRFGGAA